MILAVRAVLAVLTGVFAIIAGRDLAKNKNEFSDVGWGKLLGTGFITDFFDTLGIGSFSPTIAIWKFGNMIDDRLIPGSLNVGHTIPVVFEALLFIGAIEVDPLTLVLMLGSATIGATLAAGVVAKLPTRQVKLVMGIALLAVVVIMLAGQLNLMPVGGEATGLTGIKLVIGVVGNFILGALMTVGIGLYAPAMALVYALGMSARVAFPIMMGSCAFLMPAAGMRFVKEGAYDRKASLALTLGGVVGVVIAFYIVKELPLNILTWLVMAVIAYTGITMLREVAKDKKTKEVEV